jgi:hypothetical protein
MRVRYLGTFTLFALLTSGTFLGLSCMSGGPLPRYEAQLEADAPRKFILFGDSRKTLTAEFWRKSYEVERARVIEALAAEDPAFIVNTGDLVRYGSDAREWRVFFDENQPIFAKKIPYYPGLGNHEYTPDKESGLAHYFGMFPQLQGRKWYEIRFAPVLILVLDSNFRELLEWELESQERWLSETLEAAEKDPALRHVILCFHHAPYTNSATHTDSKAVQERFLPRLTPKVKAVVAGHVHAYERFQIKGVWYVVSGGGGAPMTPVLRSQRHPDFYKGSEYRRFHYCRFSLEGERLACDVIMLQDDNTTWKRVDGFECP